MGVAFIPFYIRFMGVEAYAIVGVFASLQGMLAVLDLGLSQAMNREMSRLSVGRGNAGLMADTARTLEVVYWCVALAVAAVIALLADFIAYRWLNPEHLSRPALVEALWVIAVVVGLRWPVSLYTGGLNGLQRQVTVNVLVIVTATFQGIGALAVLWLVEPTIRAFFLWQALIGLIQVVAFRVAFWRCVFSERKGVFRGEVLGRVWRFAAGMSGISLLATILTQMDKVLLSRLLPLADFGYYVFAATVAGVVYKLVIPVFTAYYPRLTELVSTSDRLGLIRVYHQSCQLMATAFLPATLTIAFFSKDILELWSRDPEVAAHSYLLVSLLIIGNALNGFMYLPYALQLAHGWTRLTFYTNVIAVLFLGPAIYFSTERWGAVGAASVWIVLNMGYLLINVQVMHLYLLVGEKWRWYRQDVLYPLLVVLLAAGIIRAIATPGFLHTSLPGAVVVPIAAMATMLSAILATPLGRNALRGWLQPRIK